MAHPERIAIVGASLGGLRSAQSLRGRGKYEGSLTLIGAEPHLPYDRPSLSKQLLAGEWEPARTLLESPDAIDKLDLDLRVGVRAEGLDLEGRTLALSDGETVAFDGLIIATGASPRTLPGTPDLAGIHTLRTIDDSLRIRAAFAEKPRVAVVGAGFIGAEVAAVARSAGLDVTLIEALPAPLANALGAEIGSACEALQRSHGVDVRCNTLVSGFEGTERVERVLLADGSSVDADIVVVGIGVAPETGWLEGSGLELRDGIVCDATCAAAPGVYAVGDVRTLVQPDLRGRDASGALDERRPSEPPGGKELACRAGRSEALRQRPLCLVGPVTMRPSSTSGTRVRRAPSRSCTAPSKASNSWRSTSGTGSSSRA